MTNDAKVYNRAGKALAVIHCMSALGPNLRIGQLREYLDGNGFASGKTGSAGNLYAVLQLLEKVKVVERERIYLPVTNPARKTLPRVYLYNLTALGHKCTFQNEHHLREIMSEAGIRKVHKEVLVPIPRAEPKCRNRTLMFEFIRTHPDRGARDGYLRGEQSRGRKYGPIEARFRGHHTYDRFKGCYID